MLDPILRPIAGGAPVELVKPSFLLSTSGIPVQRGDYITVKHGWVTLGSALTLVVRFLSDTGELVESVFSIPASGGVFAENEYQLIDGILLSVSLEGTTALYTPGGEYASMSLKSQSLDATAQFMHLASGYISRFNGLSYPPIHQAHDRSGPPLVRENITNDPAAATGITINVDADTDWSLVSGVLSLTTDANVANRVVFIRITTGGQVVGEYFACAAQAASLTYTYCFTRGAVPTGVVGTRVAIPIPDHMFVEGGSTVLISVDNFQAGDNLTSMPYQVEQRIRMENF